MKKILLGMVSVATFCIATLTNTCPVALTNDTGKPVLVKTNDTESPELTLQPGQEGRFGNHAVHVEFTVNKQDAAGNYSPLVSVKQLECAKRLVVVTVNSLLRHQYSDGVAIHPYKFAINRLDKSGDMYARTAETEEAADEDIE